MPDEQPPLDNAKVRMILLFSETLNLVGALRCGSVHFALLHIKQSDIPVKRLFDKPSPRNQKQKTSYCSSHIQLLAQQSLGGEKNYFISLVFAVDRLADLFVLTKKMLQVTFQGEILYTINFNRKKSLSCYSRFGLVSGKEQFAMMVVVSCLLRVIKDLFTRKMKAALKDYININ